MSTSNEKFQAILAAAEAAIKMKIEAIAGAEANAKTNLEPTILFVKETAKPFYDVKLDLLEFDFDGAKVLSELTKFSEKGITKADDLETEVTKLSKVILKAGLKDALEAAKASDISVINARILSIDTSCRRNITGALTRFFAIPNFDFQADPAFKKFKKMQVRHEPIRKQYRKALRNGDISGLEGDVLNLKLYRDFFKIVAKKKDFLLAYDRLTDVMEKRVKVITPVVA